MIQIVIIINIKITKTLLIVKNDYLSNKFKIKSYVSCTYNNITMFH